MVTEEYFEKKAMELDLGDVVEPYDEEDLEILFRAYCHERDEEGC